MPSETQLKFGALPGMLFNYFRVVTSGKPLLAPGLGSMGRTSISAASVRVRQSHLTSYRAVCGIAIAPTLPHAFPHVLAMPLHMCVFTSPHFPVKVLGLIHLRNTIRCIEPIDNAAELSLHVECDTIRETPSGQEFDLLTHAELRGRRVWEEISTMLAHRAAPGQRPIIERAGQSEIKSNFDVSADTGRRYARVSGDFNPIHLSARTASWFGFKQAVAHGMWSMSRSLGAAAPYLAKDPLQIDTQFKLPLYLPSSVIFRCQREVERTSISLSSVKGDRMHLAIQVKRL
jgi:hypothetical protein